MGVRLALVLALAHAAGADEIAVDPATATIAVRGAGAPALNAPSAEVGRVKAERTARADAAKRLARGLAALAPEKLGCRDAAKLPTVDQALQRAETAAIQWGSDGSVQLTLRVKTADLVGGRVGVLC